MFTADQVKWANNFKILVNLKRKIKKIIVSILNVLSVKFKIKIS